MVGREGFMDVHELWVRGSLAAGARQGKECSEMG